MRMIIKRRFWFTIILICSILVLALSFSPFIGKTTLAAISPWLEMLIDSEFNGAECIYATDVDKDGDMDILGAASYDDDIVWYNNSGSQVFTKEYIDNDFDGANYVYAIDIDADNDVDVLGSAAEEGTGGSIVLYRNNGSQDFTDTVIIDGAFGGANYVYAANIKGDTDNHLDVLATAANANTIAWYENNGAEGFTQHVIDSSFSGVAHAYAIDIDKDGDMDILGAAYTGDEIAWYENTDGNGTFSKHSIDTALNGANYVYAADVNGDTEIDVLATAGEADSIILYKNDGNEDFSISANIVVIDGYFDGASSAHADDINGDGRTDIVGTATDAGDIAWYLQKSDGGFEKKLIDGDFWAYDGASTGARHVYTVDIEIIPNDDFIDVVACAYGSSNGKVSWFQYPFGLTEGCFIATAAYGTPMAGEIDVLRDFRDQYLLTNPVGEALVDLYYNTSPPIADYIDDHPALKQVVRTGLEPFIALSWMAINMTLAQKIATVSSIILLSVLLFIRLRRSPGKVAVKAG